MNAPTPTAIITTSVHLLTAGDTPRIWSASTCTSGSAIVTRRPMTKETESRRGRLRLAVRAAPLRSPIGVMPRSTPASRSVSPTMTISPLSIKRTVSPVPSGANVRESTVTMATIGRTEAAVSLNLRNRFTQSV